jgi:hemerythrin
MTLIWKTGYSTGVPELDEQHRHVFSILNELEDLISRGIYDSPGLDAQLKRLGSHITRHFSTEEGCMERANCPMAMKNKQEHEQFLNMFVDFSSRFSKEKTLSVLAEFHESAENWIHEHVAFVDIHLRSCVKPVQR